MVMEMSEVQPAKAAVNVSGRHQEGSTKTGHATQSAPLMSRPACSRSATSKAA
jgi:hypothetical protein